MRSAHRIRGSLGEPLAPPPYGYMQSPDNPKKWIIDHEVAPNVKFIFDCCIEGKGVETTARLLQEREILTPMHYWQSKGLGRGGRKSQANRYKWSKSSIRKILVLPEYAGDLVNFKTYSKSFKNKTRYINPEENRKVFKNNHQPIIDRETWEQVQSIRKNTKRRKPKTAEKNMFCDLLYCADCGSKLWFNVNHPNTDIHYFSCSNYKGSRGTCPSTHYIRADSVEQIVKLELSKMLEMLQSEEEQFVKLLIQKNQQDVEVEKKMLQSKLATAQNRNDEVSRMYERVYEDNVNQKISDERFMQLSTKYDLEQAQLKQDISALQGQLEEFSKTEVKKDRFLSAIRNFMEMKVLTPAILRELVERIEVYPIEGKGKNRTQRVLIFYKFIGLLEIPKTPETDSYTLESRQGVAINYMVVA